MKAKKMIVITYRIKYQVNGTKYYSFSKINLLHRHLTHTFGMLKNIFYF